MIGAVWNVRGLNKACKLKCISDFIQDQNLDFVGFQETKKENFSESFLKAVNCGTATLIGTLSLPMVLLGVSWWGLMIGSLRLSAGKIKNMLFLLWLKTL